MTKILLTLLAVGALISGFTCSKDKPQGESGPAAQQSVPMEAPEDMEGIEGIEDLSETEVESEQG